MMGDRFQKKKAVEFLRETEEKKSPDLLGQG
jgi:hypothetical protein